MAKVTLTASRRIGIIAGLLVLLVISAVWFIQRPPSLPANIKSEVPFKAFMPTKLPNNYHIQDSSYDYQSGVLTFRIEGLDGKSILISQQPEPGNFDIGGFHDILKDKQAVETAYGTAHIGKSENTKVGSLLTSGLWIFLSSPPSTDSEDLKTVLSHLVKT